VQTGATPVRYLVRACAAAYIATGLWISLAVAALARSLRLVSIMADSTSSRAVIARDDLPGATPADVSLQIHQTRLLITAGVEGAAQLLKHLEGDGHVIYRRDRGTGGYFRSLLLPDGVQVDDIKATMTDGVLVVTVPATNGEEPHA
jgi:HSP20 family molecular chaperone IbpA